MRNVLVLDPQEKLKTPLAGLDSPNIVLHPARTIEAAEQLLQRISCSVGLVVFDLESGLAAEQIELLVGAHPATEWIALVTTEALADPAFHALLLGPLHDYHTLPFDPQRLAVTIGHAHGKARLRLAANAKTSGSGCFGMYGASPIMLDFFRQLDKVITADLPVLVGGESGTGKELVAQAIHKYSKRSSGPLVVVNCGAIPANLIQSELFGHEKGAFTGALQRKIGSIEAANGGVLFLDEIGDLPLDLQANLLRVLQERSIVRVGSTQRIAVDFRIVAATHVDLRQAISAGRFREDLYYRLNVVHLQLPPLRDRGGDIQLLAEAVLRNFSAANRPSPVVGFSNEALRAMMAYRWPGNVREMINRVHRAVIMTENRLISAADLGLENYATERRSQTLEQARATFDRDIIESSLRANGNNMSQTARQLGVSRVTLYRILNRSAASG